VRLSHASVSAYSPLFQGRADRLWIIFASGALVYPYLELAQPPHFARQQPAELLLPIEIRCLADPSLAANLGNRRSFIPCFSTNAI
jgi:hypothetical protein